MDKYKGEDLDQMTEQQWQLLTTSFKVNKPLEKIKNLSELILKVDADIILLTEVGGLESLENFNKYFLNDNFEIIHHKTNSDRGIDIAALVKPGLNIYSFFHNKSVFARGVLEINFKHENKHICILHTHLKSKLNMEGKDFEGRSQRMAEVDQMIKIIKRKSPKKNKINFIVTGDLNGVIYKDQTEPELAKFANDLGLIDCFERLNYPIFERFTYVYYNKQEEALLMQLDYCLVDNDLGKALNPSTSVLDFEGERRLNFASNRKEKHLYPSDHYPIFISLNLAKF